MASYENRNFKTIWKWVLLFTHWWLYSGGKRPQCKFTYH